MVDLTLGLSQISEKSADVSWLPRLSNLIKGHHFLWYRTTAIRGDLHATQAFTREKHEVADARGNSSTASAACQTHRFKNAPTQVRTDCVFWFHPCGEDNWTSLGVQEMTSMLRKGTTRSSWTKLRAKLKQGHWWSCELARIFKNGEWPRNAKTLSTSPDSRVSSGRSIEQPFVF